MHLPNSSPIHGLPIGYEPPADAIIAPVPSCPVGSPDPRLDPFKVCQAMVPPHATSCINYLFHDLKHLDTRDVYNSKKSETTNVHQYFKTTQDIYRMVFFLMNGFIGKDSSAVNGKPHRR